MILTDNNDYDTTVEEHLISANIWIHCKYCQSELRMPAEFWSNSWWNGVNKHIRWLLINISVKTNDSVLHGGLCQHGHQ